MRRLHASCTPACVRQSRRSLTQASIDSPSGLQELSELLGALQSPDLSTDRPVPTSQSRTQSPADGSAGPPGAQPASAEPQHGSELTQPPIDEEALSSSLWALDGAQSSPFQPAAGWRKHLASSATSSGSTKGHGAQRSRTRSPSAAARAPEAAPAPGATPSAMRCPVWCEHGGWSACCCVAPRAEVHVT